MNEPILGCIADDLTGATDLCNNLVRAGMRVVLTIDVPTEGGSLPADAIVVALKSRLPLAARARRPADLLQGVLHIRLDAQRQYWSGDRGADG
jgi:uncharacterized protein YgbK (DUF1537 family)